MTNVTAMPIPKAVSIFLETPRNGQMPRKRDMTKLLTRIPPIKIVKILPMFSPPPYAVFFLRLVNALTIASRMPSAMKPPGGAVMIAIG